MSKIFLEQSMTNLNKNDYDNFNQNFTDTEQINPYAINIEVDLNVSIDQNLNKIIENSFNIKKTKFREKNQGAPDLDSIFDNNIFNDKSNIKVISTFQEIRISKLTSVQGDGYKTYKKKGGDDTIYKGRIHEGVDIVNAKSKNNDVLKIEDIDTNQERKVYSIFKTAEVYKLFFNGLGNTVALRHMITNPTVNQNRYTGVIVFYSHMDAIRIDKLSSITDETYSNDSNESYLFDIGNERNIDIGVYGKSGFESLNDIPAHIHLEIYYDSNFSQNLALTPDQIKSIRKSENLINPRDLSYFKNVLGIDYIENKLTDFIQVDELNPENILEQNFTDGINIKNINIPNNKSYLNNLVKKSINKYSNITLDSDNKYKYNIFFNNDKGYYLTNDSNIIDKVDGSYLNKVINIKKTIDRIDTRIDLNIDFKNIIDSLNIQNKKNSFEPDNLEDFEKDILRFYIPLRLFTNNNSNDISNFNIKMVQTPVYNVAGQNIFLLIQMKKNCIASSFQILLENDGNFSIEQLPVNLKYKDDYTISIVKYNSDITKFEIVNFDKGHFEIDEYELSFKSDSSKIDFNSLGKTHIINEIKSSEYFLNCILYLTKSQESQDILRKQFFYQSKINSDFNLESTQNYDDKYKIIESVYTQKDIADSIIKKNDFYIIKKFADNSEMSSIQKENSMQNNGFFFYDLNNFHISPIVVSPLLKQPICLDSTEIYKYFEFKKKISQNISGDPKDPSSIDTQIFLDFLKNLIKNIKITDVDKYKMFSDRFKKDKNSFSDLFIDQNSDSFNNAAGKSRLATFIKYYTFGTTSAGSTKLFGNQKFYNADINFNTSQQNITRVVTYAGSDTENDLWPNIFDGFLRIDMNKYCEYLMTEVMKLDIVKIVTN